MLGFIHPEKYILEIFLIPSRTISVSPMETFNVSSLYQIITLLKTCIKYLLEMYNFKAFSTF